jgi:hypothetical protein
MADFRWTIRGINPQLVKRMRILAIVRGVTLQVLVDRALSEFLSREEKEVKPDKEQGTESDRLPSASPAATEDQPLTHPEPSIVS